jgi:hypothetical protein
MRYFLLTGLFVGCAQTIVPFSEISRNHSSAIIEKGQVQLSAAGGGLINEGGIGKEFANLGAQLGLGKGLELSLSGYDVGPLTNGFCNIECATRIGMMLSSDRPEEEGFLKRSFAGEFGFGVGGGVTCEPLPPPLGPFEATCSPRPTFYGTDFGLVFNATPHHEVSPYAAAGGQLGLQRDPETQNIQGSLWLRSALGLELSFKRAKFTLEGGLLGTGIKQTTSGNISTGSVLALYYVSTGIRVVLGKPPKLAPVEDMQVYIPKTKVTPKVSPTKKVDPKVLPAPQPNSQPTSQPTPTPWVPEGWSNE